MSIANDYMDIINLMWDIEQFDMWAPLNHLNLAYVIDKLAKDTNYEQVTTNWKALAKQKDFNKLAWDIKSKTFNFIFEDDSFSTEEKNNWKKGLGHNKELFDRNILSNIIVLGMGRERYAPSWFMDLFKSYMPLKEVERDNAIKEYCRNECGLTAEETEEAFAKISRWYDIHNEFYFYVKNKRFKKWSPVLIQLRTEDERVVTAEEICATTNLSPLKAYIWMYSARENREEATRTLLEMQG